MGLALLDPVPWLRQIPDPGQSRLERIWDEEWEQWLKEQAFERLKHRRDLSNRWLQACVLCVRQGLPAERVAALLKITTANVAVLKCRILRELRNEVGRLRRETG